LKTWGFPLVQTSSLDVVKVYDKAIVPIVFKVRAMLKKILLTKLFSFDSRQSQACASKPIQLMFLAVLAFAAPTITFANTAVAQAQTRSTSSLIQTNLSEADYAAIEALARIAENNASVIREIRADQLTPMLESLVIEMPLGSEDETEIKLEPITLLAGIMQQPALSARLREERNNQRIAVLEHYLAYLLAQQEWHLANLVFNDVVVGLGAEYQVASSMLTLEDGTFASDDLALDQDYVYFANEMFAARLDTIMALESLASVVGISPAEVLDILTEHRVQNLPSQVLAHQE
jgi:hypothetical protein